MFLPFARFFPLSPLAGRIVALCVRSSRKTDLCTRLRRAQPVSVLIPRTQRDELCGHKLLRDARHTLQIQQGGVPMQCQTATSTQAGKKKTKHTRYKLKPAHQTNNPCYHRFRVLSATTARAKARPAKTTAPSASREGTACQDRRNRLTAHAGSTALPVRNRPLSQQNSMNSISLKRA